MQIKPSAFMPSEEEINDAREPITKAEIEEALRTMQPDYTPGLTGTMRNFFMWLLTVIPGLFTAGYNNYISNHTGDPAFSWVKKRKIVFIPKSRKPRDIVDSYQPISLLEIFYKIGAKIITKRIGNTVTERISRTQF